MRAPSLLVLVASALLSVGFVACGGDDDEPAEPAPPPEEAGGEPGGGEVAAGRQIFNQQGCGSCHTLAAADANGTVGPNLDQALPGEPEAEIREYIVDPNAEIAEGSAGA